MTEATLRQVAWELLNIAEALLHDGCTKAELAAGAANLRAALEAKNKRIVWGQGDADEWLGICDGKQVAYIHVFMVGARWHAMAWLRQRRETLQKEVRCSSEEGAAAAARDWAERVLEGAPDD
jgi:hypothetical protein